ncbi:cobalamin B12-binding protein [Sphingomonas changnyeongensis]|uniref:Cobalamin B12-binding protein n=1 Tax=Sphingomonas changnyeongensis TaxID=2698679 RepID=A0A7Z2NWW5_9SPHN|nr:cobalamin-dependent protein [Sphingomonas changnyeongensis]QHL91326.1 cobalamin B12-binding protein [Sphingomonas changnyeongensis]
MATVIGFGGNQSGTSRAIPSSQIEKGIEQKLKAGGVEAIDNLGADRAAHAAASLAGPPAIGQWRIDRLARIAIDGQAHDVLREIDDLARAGMSAPTLFVDLLAPVARRLGDLWEDDRLDFIEVTMGLWRLQEVLREIAGHAPRAPAPHMPRTGLFTLLPEDVHSFGVAMVHECFVLAGWQAELLVAATRGEILSAVAASHLDLFGLTVANDSHIGPAQSLIRAVRSVSMNPNVRIMVGGPVLTRNPGLLAQIGADAMADDAIAAVKVGERLVDAVRLAAPA